MLALAMFLVKDMAEITKTHIKLTTYGLKEKLNCTTTLSRFCEVVKLIKNHLKGHKTEMHWLQSTQHGLFRPFGTILEKVSTFVIPHFYCKNIDFHGVALDTVGGGVVRL